MIVRVAAFVAVLYMAFDAAGQTRATTGDLVVIAADVDGAVLPGSAVIVTNEDTAAARSGTTDVVGRYFAPALAVGRYRVRVERPDYRAATADAIVVNVGTEIDLRVVLTLDAVTARVQVTAAAPVVDARRTAVASVIGDSEIGTLPIDRRDYTTFALLTAGVSPDRAPSQGPAQSSGLVFAGQSARANNLTVDGLDNNDDGVGGVRAVFSQDAVQEFQVLVSAYAAEFGQAAGGVVNIVTRSGSNRPLGSVFEFFRDHALNSRGYFDAPDAPFRQDQFGATVGGPLRRNHTFGFASAEHFMSRQSNAVTIDGNAAVALGTAGFPVETGNVPFVVRSTTFLGKVDQVIGRASALSARFNSAAGLDENSQPWGGLVARSSGGARDNTDDTLAVSLTSAGGRGIVHELRGQIAYRDQVVRSLDCGGACASADEGGPRLVLPGIASVGRFNTLPQARRAVRYELLDTIGHDAGAHRFKAGADVNVVDNRSTVVSVGLGGQYVFPSVQALAAGTPVVYLKGYGDGNVPNRVEDLAAFAQDEWTPTPRVTLRLGARFEKQWWPGAEYHTPGIDGAFRLPSANDHIAPRLGVAWDPSGGGRFAITAAYGLFFAHQFLAPVNLPQVVDGDRVHAAIVQGPAAVAAWRSPGHQLPASALTQLPSITLAIDPDFATPYTNQATVGVNRQLPRQLAMTVSGVFVKGNQYPGAIDYNPTLPDLGANRRPLDVNGVAGTSSSVTQYTSWGESWYRGLLVSLNKRYAAGSQWTIAYTLSKAEDTIADFLNSPPQYQGRGRNPADPNGLPIGFDPASERGPSLQDQRHRLVVSGLYDLPLQIQLSAIATAGSGRPYNIVTGVDLNGDGDGAVTPGPDRPRTVPADASTSIGRNAGLLPGETRVDARISKSFHIGPRASAQATADVLNVFNATTFTDVNRVFGIGAYPTQPLPSFGQFTQAAPPRQLQIGLRFAF